jgi:AraC family transcriptional regulator, regulatory protein of adaptative response / methylated-DNA-[protein]-cysteine methyltransferase
MQPDRQQTMLSGMSKAANNERIDQALRRAAELEFAVTVSELARLAGISTGHFQRRFRSRFGISPGRLLRHARIQRFGELLRAGMSVTDAALETGFGSSSRSYQAAQDGLGMAPSRVRAGGKGERIEFGISDCHLGKVLVAATARGLCAVLMGDRADELTRELEQRFPQARLRTGSEGFSATQQRVIELIEQGRPATAELPLDLRGTVFQQRVWRALQQIPAGETITYGELARRLAVPGGARAVARACGANPTAVVVPCHRVVAADGGLGGYRWGIERKKALLEQESFALVR